jgi:hypothetical protein
MHHADFGMAAHMSAAGFGLVVEGSDLTRVWRRIGA